MMRSDLFSTFDVDRSFESNAETSALGFVNIDNEDRHTTAENLLPFLRDLFFDFRSILKVESIFELI